MQRYNLILTMQVPLGVLAQQKPEDKTANTLEQMYTFLFELEQESPYWAKQTWENKLLFPH